MDPPQAGKQEAKSKKVLFPATGASMRKTRLEDTEVRYIRVDVRRRQ